MAQPDLRSIIASFWDRTVPMKLIDDRSLLANGLGLSPGGETVSCPGSVGDDMSLLVVTTADPAQLCGDPDSDGGRILATLVDTTGQHPITWVVPMGGGRERAQ